MRKMKTTMDIQIRQTKSRSFQNGDLAIRQAASYRMSSASALRQEVLSELPDQYRRVLNSMSPKEQERLLYKVEATVNRKVSSGAIARTAARLDEQDRREIQKLAAGISGSREAQKQALADRYRLPKMKQRAGPDGTRLSVPADSPQMRRYIEETIRRQSVQPRYEPSVPQVIENQEPGRNGFMRTMDECPLADIPSVGNSGSRPASNSAPLQTAQLRALQEEYRRQHSADGDRLSASRQRLAAEQEILREPDSSIGAIETPEAAEASSETAGPSNRTAEPLEQSTSKRGITDLQKQAAKNAFIEKTVRSETSSSRKTFTNPQTEEISKNIDITAENISTYTDSSQSQLSSHVNSFSEMTEPAVDMPEQKEIEEAKLQAALTQYQQSLLASAKSGKGRRQIESAMQKALAGNAGRKEQITLRNANQKAAYYARHTTNAYREMLAETGIQTDGQKAAIQMAYEKQVRAVLKSTYRKELIGKLSKQKTQALMKKAEEKRYQREREQENELNRAMTDQMRSTAGAMSAGAKVLRRIAEEVVKAVKTLVQKKLILFIIPFILIVAIPVVMVAFPLISAVTATSSEDNEVYAYADAAELIAYAQQWIGKIPYVWGGGHGGSAMAWQSGCDCSGFVHGVFNHFGYEIGGDTGAMETQAGTHIAYDSLANAKPGDVIIYYRTAAHVKGDPNGSGSTHVSIYEGNNRIIHQAGGVHESTEYHQYFEVRRVLTADVAGRGNISGGLGGMGTYGHRTDSTNYSTSDLQLIWAIVAQEDNGSYKGALAVISTAMNRVESPQWSYEGSNALAQLTAPGQFCYSNDHYWEARLGGNVPDYVKQAVNDCLKKGKRNHSHTSFRSTKGKTTGADAVQIGGNWYFG